MTYVSFESKILNAITNSHRKSTEQNFEGFSCSCVTGGSISIANTAEALLSLEIMSNYNNIQEAYLDKFNYNNIKNLFSEKSNEIIAEKKKKISDLAYCGIGLVLLNGEEKTINCIADTLLNCQLRDGGWSNYSDNNQADLFSTFIALELLNRLNKKPDCPTWLSKDNFRSDPSGTQIIRNSGINNQNSVEALTLALYIQNVFYKMSINEDYIKYINEYFRDKVTNILNSDFANWFEHPISNYKIYAFGLAAHLCKNVKDSFISPDFIDYSKLCDDFATKNNREIPINLEYLKLIKNLKDTIDPFKMNKNKNIQIDEVNSIINTTMSTTIFSILFFSVLLLIIFYGFEKLKIEFTGYQVVEIIIALIIELVLNYFELFSKISTIYFTIIDKIKKRHNVKGGKNEKKDSKK